MRQIIFRQIGGENDLMISKIWKDKNKINVTRLGKEQKKRKGE